MRRPFLIPSVVVYLGLAALLLFSGACSNKAKRKNVEISGDPITAKSADAQKKFDGAFALLEAGEWGKAREKFRLVQAEYPNDPIADLAELYVARASLGELYVLGEEVVALKPDVAAMFARLGDDPSVDDRIRYAAMLYYAAALASSGDVEAALLSLKDYPGPSLSPAVIHRDRTAAWTLLAESLSRAARFEGAVVAFERLHRESAAGEGEAALAAFARSRAFDVASGRLTEAELEEFSTDADSAFLRAVGGSALFERTIREDATQKHKEALAALHRRIAPDLVAIGESERVAENSMFLAAYGPVSKLVIGAVVPMSGPDEAVGRDAMQAMLLAQGALSPDEPEQVTLVFGDATEEAATVLKKLREAGAVGVVGLFDARQAEAFAMASLAAELPIVALTTQELPAQEEASMVFRMFADPRAEAEATARVSVETNRDERIAILYPDIGYGRRMKGWFRAAVVKHGGTVVEEVAYDRSRTDFDGPAGEVAAARPDAVYIPDTSGKVAQVSAFLAQNNVWGIPHDERPSSRSKRTQVHYLGTSLWQKDVLVRQAASYVAGATIPAWSSRVYEDADSRSFHAEFRQTFGTSPGDVEAFAYDAVSMLRARLVRQRTTTPEALAESLRAATAYRGVTGAVRFRPDGKPVQVLRFVTVEDDAFAPAGVKVVVGLPEEPPASGGRLTTDEQGAVPSGP